MTSVDKPDVTVASRPAVASAHPWVMPPVDSAAPGPGLHVHGIDLPGRDLATAVLRLDGPITTEALDIAGVASITAGSLDEGTEHHDGNTFAAALDRIGADWSPSAGFGGTMLRLTAPGEHLEAGLALMAEAVFTATFPERDVARLIGQRHDRITSTLATPAGRADVVLRQVAVDPGHRASLPAGGTHATVEALDRDDVIAHHRDTLLTGPADLVLVGDLSTRDLPLLAAEHFGQFVAADRDRAPADPLRLQPGGRLVLVDHPGAVQTELRVVGPGPDVHADDRAATRLMAHVLGGPLTSRLDAVLREDRGFTYGVRSSLRSFRRGGMFVVASGSFETDTTAEALDLIRNLSTTFVVDGPTDDEVERARDYLTGVIPLSLETPGSLASVVAGNIGDDLATDHTSIHLAQLGAATRDEVAAAANTHLDVDDLVVAVGDLDSIGDDLQALGWGDVIVHQD